MNRNRTTLIGVNECFTRIYLLKYSQYFIFKSILFLNFVLDNQT